MTTYFQIVAQCVHGLHTVETFLDKLENHAAEKNLDVEVLLNARLAPDMKGLIYQVQSACDYTKGAAALLTGQIPPRHEDTEQTMAEVRERLRKTVAFAKSLSEAQYGGAAERRISVSWEPGKVLAGEDYVTQITIPNVFFHIAMVYATLRNAGVNVGKMDFLGPMNFVAA